MVATGVMKAAIDAESLGRRAGRQRLAMLWPHLSVTTRERQPYGASLVARGRHIGVLFHGRGMATGASASRR